MIKKKIKAEIDFDPNTLNLTGNGNWITCYIELPEPYAVEAVVPPTVKLNGTVPAEKTDIGDYDKDGVPDLMVKFSREQTANLLQTGDAVTVKVSVQCRKCSVCRNGYCAGYQ